MPALPAMPAVSNHLSSRPGYIASSAQWLTVIHVRTWGAATG